MDQQQFADYLFQGLGRPYLYLQRHDAAPYREQLLHACLYNPVYDSQCEGSRANYLHEIIQLTQDPAWYIRRLLESLADPDDLHAIGLRISEVFERNPRKEATKLFVDLYERGPVRSAESILWSA